ncbi:MAG: hypothetical protein WCA46_28030 [Actinocatenispora sp.]
MNTRRVRRLGVSAGIALGLALGFLPAGQAQAAATHVRCHDIHGLAAAISQANYSGHGRIQLASGCTYTLARAAEDTVGLPVITGDVRISASPRPAVIERGYGAPDFRIFGVASGGRLTLDRLVITGGSVEETGGGILNEGTLALNHTVVRGNHAAVFGGGIHNVGTLTMRGGAVRDNASVLDGGGVENWPTGTATIRHASITGNTSGNLGGGIDNFANSTLRLTDTVVRGNRAVLGGGLDNFVGSTMILTRSVVSHNTASNAGGGIFADETGGPVTLRYSAVVHNRPDNCAGGNPVPGCHDTAASRRSVTAHRVDRQKALGGFR